MNIQYIRNIGFFWVLGLLGMVGHARLYGQDSAFISQMGLDTVGQQKVTALMQKIDSIQRADSLQRAELLRKIDALAGSRKDEEREKLEERLRGLASQDSVRRNRLQREIDVLKSTAKGFPVVPFRDTLFSVFTRVGSFNAAERAGAVASKIRTLYEDRRFHPDSLRVHTGESAAEIVFGDTVVMSISELDALWFGQEPMQLAEEYRGRIAMAIRNHRDENNLKSMLMRSGAVMLILVGVYLLIVLINRLFRRLKKKLITLKEKWLKGIRFKGYQFLDSNRELRVAIFLTNIVRLLTIVVVLYIALPVLFSIFPWTRGMADTLIGWVADPLLAIFRSIFAYLPNLFTILVIALVTHYTVKFVRFIAGEIEKGALVIPGFYADWAKPTYNLVQVLLYAFGFIIIFPYLPGSDSPIFQGVSVFLGILFSLGSSSAISNAVAGLVITYMRPFKIGDRIKIGEVVGDVIEKSMLVTRIRTIKNEEITIPNSSILSGHTINYTASARELGLILHTTVTIGYDVPWREVHQLLIDAALATPGVLNQGRKPFVLQTGLDDFYVSYQINAYTEDSHRVAAIYSELYQNIQDKFNEAGVEIMSPHYRAVRDGNTTTVIGKDGL